jgi:NTP pyrophosphatase (non-canonical NTP hydrolase)
MDKPWTAPGLSSDERTKYLASRLFECDHFLGATSREAVREALEAHARDAKPPSDTLQDRVKPWLLACFGEEIANDFKERNHRFLEEALELVQACGCTQSEAHQLVDYVYGRPIGEKEQECGGVMITLAALCLAQQIDMHECGERELERIWSKIEKIREKQANKPKHSPLPELSRDAKPQWTPVEEGLPNTGIKIILRDNVRNITKMAWLCDTEWVDDDHYPVEHEYFKATHWMYIPACEPPREDAP